MYPWSTFIKEVHGQSYNNLIAKNYKTIFYGLFGSKPLQFLKFGETPLLFALLEKRHCNSPVHANSPFSTLADALGVGELGKNLTPSKRRICPNS
jgi:hypothetical protein